jgi:hypothetical protein
VAWNLDSRFKTPENARGGDETTNLNALRDAMIHLSGSGD